MIEPLHFLRIDLFFRTFPVIVRFYSTYDKPFNQRCIWPSLHNQPVSTRVGVALKELVAFSHQVMTAGSYMNNPQWIQPGKASVSAKSSVL